MEFERSLALAKNARNLIGREGYDPVYGARPLKRAIQKLILDPLSEKIIAGEFKEGDKIQADVSRKGAEEEITFKKT